MSVLIKGVDMPEDSHHHTITIYSDGTVATGKPNNYKAIEIETPHGRLADADNIKVFSDLWEAPTVIEAEE